MNDTIYRQAALRIVGVNSWAGFRINALPSAQPEIIRCKECKYHGINECFHKLGMIASMDDGFCSYAERRTDENNSSI